ncbi:MAG: DUF4332 domain-containing protein [Planctomycetota bacterium]
MLRTLLTYLSSRRRTEPLSVLTDSTSMDRPLVEHSSSADDDTSLPARFPAFERQLPVGSSARIPPNMARVTKPPLPNHRARLLSMKLEHVRLCSEKRCRMLSSIGIITVGDLVTAEPLAITKTLHIPAKAEATLRRYQQAIRLAASVPGLMPRDAMLLVAIHRRTVRALAIESPALLQRDLERFAMSSRGQRQLRGRRLPSLRRIRKWIDASSIKPQLVA